MYVCMYEACYELFIFANNTYPCVSLSVDCDLIKRKKRPDSQMSYKAEDDDYEYVEYPPPNYIFSSSLPKNYENMTEESLRTKPLTEEEFASFFDRDGRLKHEEKFKRSVFRGSIDPSIRKEAWKFLFGYFCCQSTLIERTALSLELNSKYEALKLRWIEELLKYSKLYQMEEEDIEHIPSAASIPSSTNLCSASSESSTKFDSQEHFLRIQAQIYAGREPFDVKESVDNLRMINKDVPRTDRDHSYFRDDDDGTHQNMLRNVLLTYASYHADVGYVQGMNDIASRFLIVLDSEPEAYWCFSTYMNKFKDDYLEDRMLQRLEILRSLLSEIDGDLYKYVEAYHLHDLAFCHRWLLLNFLREFNFEDGLSLFEVLCSNYLEMNSYEAEKAREVIKEKIFGLDDKAVFIPIDLHLTFNLFVCVAILIENRKELFSCTDTTGVIQCMTSMPRRMTVGQILTKAEILFFTYCQRSVIESFQILDVTECNKTRKGK